MQHMCPPVILNMKAFHCNIFDTVVALSAATIQNREKGPFIFSRSAIARDHLHFCFWREGIHKCYLGRKAVFLNFM